MSRPARLAPLALVLGLFVATVSASPAVAARCLPEVDDEVLVFFEPGPLSDPVVIGGLWNGADRHPPESATGQVIAPRVLAKALLAAVGEASGKRDGSTGAVARWLVETTAGELEALHRTLEAVYESGFVGTAEGDAALGRLGFVASRIEGTFEAIVDASIQQMEAYGALVAAVSASLDAYAAGEIDHGGDDVLLRHAAALIRLDLSLRDPDPDCED